MLRLKDIVSTEELKLTMKCLNLTKNNFGTKEFILLKKIMIVAGFIYGRSGYISYKSFLNSVYRILTESKNKPTGVFGFSTRGDCETFYGEKCGFIRQNSIETVRQRMCKRIDEIKQLSKL